MRILSIVTDHYNVIVGGGLAGLFAAKVLLHRGYKNVVLIEKSLNTGGLLQNTVVENPLEDGRNFSFDHGTHFILAPKDENIHPLIRQDLSLSEYYTFEDSLLEGHVINGTLYEPSGCASVFAFPFSIQQQIKSELSELHSSKKTSVDLKNLKEECLIRYGKVATETIYEPAYKKFTGLPLDELDVSMGNYFAPGRLITENRETAKELKQDPDWDWRLAYSDCVDGASEIVKYYPKNGGIGQWLNQMTKNLEACGVKILTDTTVDAVDYESRKISTISLSTGETLLCEKFIWTLPAIFLSKLTQTEVPSLKPSIRYVRLVNFLIKGETIKRPYWITVYDDQFQSCRVTLYDNFAPDNKDVVRVSVEMLHDGTSAKESNFEQNIFYELKLLEILDEDAELLWAECSDLANGFPVQTPLQKETYMQQNQILEDKFENLHLVGPRPDTGGGQIEIMNYIWQRLV